MRKRFLGAVVVGIAAVAVLYAQEPRVFLQGVEIHAGSLTLGKSIAMIFEGATADESETTLTVADPTADRTWTIPDAASDTFVGKATTDTLTNKTLTAPILTTPLVKEFTEDVTATNVIAVAESGSTFFLNSATEFVSTLPAPAAGLRFKFYVVAAPSGASYTVVTTSSSNIIKGLQVTAQDAGGSGDSGTADDTISFVDGQAVAGDWCDALSDGTSWLVTCHSKVLAGLTFTQAS